MADVAATPVCMECRQPLDTPGCQKNSGLTPPYHHLPAGVLPDRQGVAPMDNTLALGQFMQRAERCRLAWFLSRDLDKVTPEFAYELRIHGDGPARGIYHGRTASHAATAAMLVLDHHQIGWSR